MYSVFEFQGAESIKVGLFQNVLLVSSNLPKNQQKFSKISALASKGGLFSESEIRFSNLQNKLLQITILNLKFEIPAHNTKQLIQISSSG